MQSLRLEDRRQTAHIKGPNSCALFSWKTILYAVETINTLHNNYSVIIVYCPKLVSLPVYGATNQNKINKLWLWLFLKMNVLFVWGHTLALVQPIPPSPFCLEFLRPFRLMWFPPTLQRSDSSPVTFSVAKSQQHIFRRYKKIEALWFIRWWSVSTAERRYESW